MNTYINLRNADLATTCTPWLLSKVCGVDPLWCPEDKRGKVLGACARLSEVRPYDVVWGASIGWGRYPRPHMGVSLLSLLGSMSAKAYGSHPSTLGTPLSLLGALWDEPMPELKNALASDCGYPNSVPVTFSHDWRHAVRQLLEAETVVTDNWQTAAVAESFQIRVLYQRSTPQQHWDFDDYLTGTDRNPKHVPPFGALPPFELDRVQNRLFRASEEIVPRLARAQAMANNESAPGTFAEPK